MTAKLPPDVERYFLAQLVATIFIDAGMKLLGTKSIFYAAIYSLCTILIIVTMVGMLNVKSRYGALLSGMMAAIVGWICFVALPRPLHYYNWISIAEGMALSACGTYLIFSTRKALYMALAVLWLALAGWRLCYCLEMTVDSWRAMNLWCPASLCIATFTWIGASQRNSPIRRISPLR